MYCQDTFLDEQLAIFIQERELDYVAMVNPDDFVRWVFPRLYYTRIPKYEVIADEFAYTLSTTDISSIENEEGFLALLASVLDK